MDLIESGGIFNFRPANISQSRLEVSGTNSVSRFEELFLASPRAKELSSTANVSSYLSSSLSFTPKTSSTSNNSSIENTRNNTVFEDSNLFIPLDTSPDRFDLFKSQVTDVLTSLRTPKNTKSNQSYEQEGVSSFKELPLKDIGNYLQQVESTCISRDEGLDKNNVEDAISLVNGNNEEVQHPNDNDDHEDDDEIMATEIINDDVFTGGDRDDEAIADADERVQEPMETSIEAPTIPLPSVIKKPHHLADWCIKAVKTKNSPPGIIVEGQRPEDAKGSRWHSTSIVTIVSSCLLETKKKSQYYLEGEIQEDVTLEQGFSAAFVKAFKHGFPPNWKTLVQEHFESIQSPPKIAHVTKSRQSRAPKPKLIKPRKTKTETTPGNLTMPMEVELKRTSSGRLIKPPLAWWRGQRIMTDGNHNMTAIEPGGEEHTALSVGLYDYDLKLPKDKLTFLQTKGMNPKTPKFEVSPTSNEKTNKNKTSKTSTMKKKLLMSDDISSSAEPHSDTSDTNSRRTYDTDSYVTNEKSGPRELHSQKHRATRHGATVVQKDKQSNSLTNKQKVAISNDDNELSEGDVGNVKRNISFSDDEKGSMSDDSDGDNAERHSPVKARKSKISSRGKENIDRNTRSTRSRRGEGNTRNSHYHKEDLQQSRRDKSQGKINKKGYQDRTDDSSQEDEVRETRQSKKERQTNKERNEEHRSNKSSQEDELRETRSKNRRQISKKNQEERSEERSQGDELRETRSKNRRQISKKNQEERSEESSQEDELRETRSKNRRQISKKNREKRSEDSSQEDELRESRSNNRRQISKKNQEERSEESSQEDNVRKTRRSKNQRQTSKTNREETIEESSQEDEIRETRRSKNNKKISKNKENNTDFISQEKNIGRGRRGQNHRQINEKEKEDYRSDESSQENKKQETKRTKITKQLKQKKNDDYSSDASSQEDDHYNLQGNNQEPPTRKAFTKLQTTNEDANTYQVDKQPVAVHFENHHNNTANKNKPNLRERDRLKQPTTIFDEEEQLSSSDDEEEAQAIAAMVSQARERKVQKHIEDEEEEEKEKAMAKKKSAIKKKPLQSETNKADIATGWNEEEILRFTTALNSIPLSSSRFWQRVAEEVETRTALECQSKYGEQLEKKPRRENTKAKQQEKPKQKVVSITGGVGTVKRKRELRQLIQQTNDGYDDDIFDSTPFKKSKTNFKIDLDPYTSDDDDDNDEDYHDDLIEEQTNKDFKTPSSRTPSSRFRPLGPGSYSSNTPTGELISPSLLLPVDRSGMDHYIRRMKHGKRGVYAQTQKVTKTSTPKKQLPLHIPKVNGSIFNVGQAPDPDSDVETDEYFSE